MANKRTYGSGALFKRGDGYWVSKITVTDANGKTKQKSFKSKDKKIVSLKLKEYQSLVAKGEHNLDDTYLETYIKNWLYNVKKITLKPTSFDRAESTIITHIIPNLGHYKISDITSELIQEKLIGEMSKNNSKTTGKPLSFSSINKAYVYLHACFQYAISNRKLIYNPCTAVVLPKQKKLDAKQVRFFNDEEIKQFKDAALSRHSHSDIPIYKYGDFFVLIMYTGLRAGELIGLKWNNVDFKNRRILVKEQVSLSLDRNDINENGNPKRKPTFFKETKSSRNRYVQLCSTANNILQEKYHSVISLNDFVVSNSQLLISTNNMIKTYLSICKRAKIANPQGLHTLRHTFASMLIRSGVDIKTVSEILGHKDVAFTYNTYVHLIEAQKITAVEKLDKL